MDIYSEIFFFLGHPYTQKLLIANRHMKIQCRSLECSCYSFPAFFIIKSKFSPFFEIPGDGHDISLEKITCGVSICTPRCSCRLECMKLVGKGDADVVLVTPGEAYVGSKDFNLVPLLYEVLGTDRRKLVYHRRLQRCARAVKAQLGSLVFLLGPESARKTRRNSAFFFFVRFQLT